MAPADSALDRPDLADSDAPSEMFSPKFNFEMVVGWRLVATFEVGVPRPGLCPMLGFGISDVEPSSSTTK
jgi:hypothetical protein